MTGTDERCRRRVLMVLGEAAGGIGVHAQDLARGLRQAGDRVVVVAPPGTASRFDLGGEREVLIAQGRDAVRRIRALARDSDVVHAQGHQAGVTALASTVGLRVPVVVSWHNAVLGHGARHRVLEVAERWQATRAALVTGASSDLVARAAALGARRAELAPVAAPAAGGWPLGLDAARHARTELTEELTASRVLPAAVRSERETWVVTVSRLAPQKDLGILATVARMLDGEGLGLRWFVVGDGDPAIRQDLLGRTRTLPFHLLGARDDVPRLLAASDLVVIPSLWEARALVVQEALAAARPVVATEVGGLPELVSGCGLLTPVGDAAALAAAVRHLATDPGRRAELGALARARFETLPDSAAVVSAWRERYRSLRSPDAC